MEDLEIRQLLTGTLWKVTLADNSPRTTGSQHMLNLQDGVTDSGDPSIIVTSQFEEKPDGMSITDFIQSLVSGTVTGTVWVGDPAVETPIAFSFPQRASTTAGDAPILIRNVGGDDTYGYTAGIAVDDYFDYESSSSHTCGNDEWTLALQPAGRISIAATQDKASEASANVATFTITPTGSAGSYALFTVSGTAICGGTHRDALTDPNADYIIDGAEQMPGEPGKFKAYFNSYSQVAQVQVIPLNDSKVEGPEDVQLTLVADEPSVGTCPAYADPAGNDATLPKQAAGSIDDLVGGPATDPEAPWDQLQGWLAGLESDEYQTRVDAKQNLQSAFNSHPAVEPILDDALQAAREAADKPQTVMDLDSILGPIRFRIDNNANTIVATFRTPATAGIAHFIVSLPASGPLVSFSATGDPNAGGIGVGENPSSVTITPAVETANHQLTFHISYTNSDGDVVGGFFCPFAFDMRTWVDIGGD